MLFPKAGQRYKRPSNIKANSTLILEEYSTRQAAEYLGLRDHALWRMRNTIGDGPEYKEVNGRIKYNKSDLDKWSMNHA